MVNFYKSSTQTTNFKPLVNLLGVGDGTEIIQYELGQNSMFFINPSLHPETYEFYYIVTGQIEFQDNIYNQYDYFDVKHTTENYGLKALEDTVLLFISSSTGEYETANNFNEILTEQLELIQVKDHYTYEHCRRVKRLVIEIGQFMNLKDSDLKTLTLAAYCHDVGKIKISNGILNKPEKLTFEEYTTMKQHVTHSFDLVKDSIDKEVADLLILHHERLDGSGYPKGLKDEEIPLLGRILAVVDSYDAMTTDRVYKQGKDTEIALKELYELSHQYDIEIVKILDEILRKKSS